MNKLTIGVDPGKSGAIAAIYPDGGVEAWKMPETERDTSDIFEELINKALLEGWVVELYLEKVHAMPGQGVTSVFSFGKNYGFLRGLIVSHKIPLIDVTPQKWQKALGVTKSETKTKHKNKLKGMAQQLYPQLKITLATADALLIANYGSKQ